MQLFDSDFSILHQRKVPNADEQHRSAAQRWRNYLVANSMVRPLLTAAVVENPFVK